VIYSLPDIYDPELNDTSIIIGFSPVPQPSWIITNTISKEITFNPVKGWVGSLEITVSLNDTKEVAYFKFTVTV
jgi:hypothetical protein